MTEISTILDRISQLHQNEQQKNASSGERFNIFQIIGLTSDEVRLHSQFIAELLNPNGTHGQGEIFLQKFLEFTGATGILTDLQNVSIHVEFPIGPVTSTSGGRIDILIQDNINNAIIIENKIYAGDQENQLLRYFNFAKGLEMKGGHFALLYLSLFEKTASDYSLGEKLTHNDYHSISYQETIINWMESCMESIQDIPKLGAGIEHYIQLIKQLTHQDFTMELQQDIIHEIIKNVETFKAADTISNSILEAKVALLRMVGTAVSDKLQSHEKVKDIFFDPDFGRQYKGIEIFLKEFKNEKDRPPHIRFSFLRNASSCYFEIHPGFTNKSINEKNHDKRLKYINTLNNHFNRSTGKILNVEHYWQGEWVMEYYNFENRFTDIIKNLDAVTEEIMRDLSIIIDHFYKVENELI